MSVPEPALPEISRQIWDMKYRLKANDGRAIDSTLSDTWQRVARAAAAAEPKGARAAWAKRFAQAMENFAFLPAGRISLRRRVPISRRMARLEPSSQDGTTT